MSNSFITNLVLSALFLLMSSTSAQDEESDVFQEESNAIIVSATSDDDGTTMGTRVMAVSSSDLADGPMFFADSFDGSFDFHEGFMGNSFSMLNNASVQKDLQLVDGQLEQIEEINKEFSEKIKEQMGQLKDDQGNFQISNTDGLGQLIRDLRQQQQEQIDSILLPNQQARLKQVTRQMKIKRMGSEKSITSHLAEELGISEEQKKRIKAKSKDLHKQIAEKIAELRANAKEELLSELSKDQRQKLEDLLGDEFVTKDEDTKHQFPKFQRFKKSQRRDF